MKIVFTVINDLSYDQRMIRIARTLAEAGHEVWLVGRKRKNSIPLKKQNFKQVRLRCFFNKGKLFYLEYNLRLFIYLLFKRLNVVSSVDLDTLLAGFLASKIKNKTLVFDAHEWFTQVPELIHRPKTRKIWLQLEKFILPKIKNAYTVNESLANIFREKFQVDFQVIRNVPFLEKKRIEKKPQEVKTILYQGAINVGRGLPEIIEAVSEIENVKLILAGNGDIFKEIKEQIQLKKIDEKVELKGWLPPDELKLLTQKADIGLNLLSNSNQNYYYSLANKCFDYIQAGIPQIAMDFPEYQKINQKFEVAILVPDLKKETLKTAIKKLLKDENLYQKLHLNCLEARKKYNWENEKQKLIRFYENLNHRANASKLKIQEFE